MIPPCLQNERTEFASSNEDSIKKRIKEVEEKTDEMIKDCRDKLLRKKNLIIENLKSTELSLLDEVNKYPRFWTSDGFKVRLTTRTALVLTAEIVVPKPLDNLEQKVH